LLRLQGEIGKKTGRGAWNRPFYGRFYYLYTKLRGGPIITNLQRAAENASPWGDVAICQCYWSGFQEKIKKLGWLWTMLPKTVFKNMAKMSPAWVPTPELKSKNFWIKGKPPLLALFWHSHIVQLYFLV